jgi:hypothetical protein
MPHAYEQRHLEAFPSSMAQPSARSETIPEARLSSIASVSSTASAADPGRSPVGCSA